MTLKGYRDSSRTRPSAVSLSNPTGEERERYAALLRLKKLSRADRLIYDLDQLSSALVAAGLPGDWDEILEQVCGPVPKSIVVAREAETGWQELWGAFAGQLAAAPFPESEVWFAALRRDGVLRKLAGGDFQTGATLLGTAIGLLRTLPLSHEQPLPQLAAQACSDSHALDPGTPLSTLVLRGLAVRKGLPMPNRARDRRKLWAEFRVICDELSSPVLTFNLKLDGIGAIARFTALATEAEQPVHLSTRWLLNTQWENIKFPAKIFLCENPAIVELAASTLGANCAPLICVDGEPKTAGWLLLRACREGGAALHYHGDFDWAGLAIARRIFEEGGALPWRFGADDYTAACAQPGRKLVGSPIDTPWSPQLRDLMVANERAFDEEFLAGGLLEDLSGATD